MYGRTQRIHFIGIGGTGMCGIAEVLLTMGYRVSGSDLRASDVTERLVKLGGRVFVGHAESNVEDADVVVLSTAVSRDNPEARAAREAGIPVIARADMLAELMRMKYGIAVGGAHGKTTTTSLIAAVLARGGLDPTVVVGGRLRALGANARLGHGEFLVAEADESDGSFLRLAPSIAVVTNVDREHLDHYDGIEAIRDAFVAFASLVPFYGVTVMCVDDAEARSLLPRISKRTITYGTRPEADVRADDVRLLPHGSRFLVTTRGRLLGEIELQVPGRHNVLNALAAVAVGCELQVGFGHVAEALAGFHGVARRFETRGEAAGVRVVDDYGHHPTEITATLASARGLGGRTLVLFQPHRYSRTRALAAEFGASLREADRVWVLDVYAAGEAPIEGVSARTIVEAAKAPHVVHAPDAAAAAAAAAAEAAPGDVVVTLGAGDVWKLGEDVLARLRTAGAGVRKGGA